MRSPTIRHLLLVEAVLVVGLPVVSLLALPLFDSYLIRQTERRLIGESVVIGEAWRDALLRERGGASEAFDHRPPGSGEERLTPLVAMVDLSYRVLPPSTEPERGVVPAADAAAARAGRSIEPMLRRTQTFNLSGVRVLDRRGCVVATSGEAQGTCLDHLEEVRAALGGSYRAVVRQRISDDPTPPITSIRRRGRLRVFTATPIFENGVVIGVVRMSRTSVAPLESLYTHRGKVGLIVLLFLVVTPALTYGISHSISKPVRSLTEGALALARGEARTKAPLGWLAPRELHDLERALDDMTEKLAGRAEYIEEFATHLSHELKTPLTGLTGAIELLQDSAASMSAEQRARFLSNMAGDALRMEQIVSRLLELARIQTAPDRAEPVALTPFLEALVARFPGSRLRLSCATDLPDLVMPPDHLDMAVSNLVDNALRHGGDGPVDVSAERIDERGQARIAIDVRDRGPGISAGNRDRIFDRFFTTTRACGGTGLGLAIVQAVAETRAGRVEVETGESGTRFRLVL